VDALSAVHHNGSELGNGRVASVELADAALGLPACALCRDPDATPVLAGDRARGPDHLYLVCDRCGQRWQRYDVNKASAGVE
jgi:hypothetical protein